MIDDKGLLKWLGTEMTVRLTTEDIPELLFYKRSNSSLVIWLRERLLPQILIRNERAAQYGFSHQEELRKWLLAHGAHETKRPKAAAGQRYRISYYD